jgi:predicted small lipoprotein YifL
LLRKTVRQFLLGIVAFFVPAKICKKMKRIKGEHQMKKIIAFLLVMVMALSLVACGNETPTTNAPVTTTNPATTAPTQETPKIGADFTVTVTDLDGTKNTFTYHSEAKTVGEALLAEGLIAGDQSDWGLMVTTVNGITADWATENAYWAFYINGEYAQTGVDATELVDGATYAFVKTVSYTEKGEGATSFYFTVKNTDGTVTKFIIHTDKTTVGAALLELGLIAGDQSDWGLMVTTVNGITADWDTEQAYWAFYINGEYAQTGVDSTDVVADAVYEMVKTVSAE